MCRSPEPGKRTTAEGTVRPPRRMGKADTGRSETDHTKRRRTAGSRNRWRRHRCRHPRLPRLPPACRPRCRLAPHRSRSPHLGRQHLRCRPPRRLGRRTRWRTRARRQRPRTKSTRSISRTSFASEPWPCWRALGVPRSDGRNIEESRTPLGRRCATRGPSLIALSWPSDATARWTRKSGATEHRRPSVDGTDLMSAVTPTVNPSFELALVLVEGLVGHRIGGLDRRVLRRSIRDEQLVARQPDMDGDAIAIRVAIACTRNLDVEGRDLGRGAGLTRRGRAAGAEARGKRSSYRWR